MTVDLLIKNAKIFLNGGLIEGGVAIDEGKIRLLATENHLPTASSTFDAHGNLVLPGCIDAHVHFRDPGRTEVEDFQTGTEAAACGGVTTVIDMPTNVPYVCTADALESKKKEIRNKAVVDYALYGGVDPKKLEEISKQARGGVAGYKVWMTASQVYPHLSDDKSLMRGFIEISKTGLAAIVHAENWQIIDYYTETLKGEGRKDALAHCESRPEIAEVDAVFRASLLAERSGVRLHIAHMSTERATAIVRNAKRRGTSVTAETCPQYLLLTQDNMKELGPYGKMNPPLRPKSDLEGVWNGIHDGTVDMIANDHAPQSLEEKEPGWRDIWSCKGGMIGVETMLPLMLTQVNSNRLSIGKLVQTLSENPARIFGLYPRKGTVQIGSDADLVVVNIKKDSLITEGSLHSKTKKTPFSGWKIKGVPVATIVRGQIVMENGEVRGKPGSGTFISPERLREDISKR
jgi:allantoinase